MMVNLALMANYDQQFRIKVNYLRREHMGKSTSSNQNLESLKFAVIKKLPRSRGIQI